MLRDYVGFFGDAGLSFLVLAALVGLLAWKRPITVTARARVRCAPERLFELVSFRPGAQDWHRSEAEVAILDPDRQTFRVSYRSVAPGGITHVSQADFRVVACEPPSRLRALRVGVAPNAPHQLLAIEARIEPEGQGSRLELRYEWGPRNLLAQLFARTEIRSSVGRLKHLAETGKRDEGIEARSSLLLAIATGALTLLGFGAWLGWTAAVLILIVVVIHEAGHLIAFRMLGQGWGRLFFIPFLGAIAVPRWPFRSQWQRAIAALMGPGLSAILLLGPLVAPDTAKPVLAQLAWIAAVINGLNLLPVLPLDGGHSLDAVLTSFGGRSVTWGMPIAAALVAAAGLLVHEPILFAVALLVLISRRPVEGAVPLSSMSTLAAALVLCLHLGLAALYAIAVLTLAA